MIIKNLFQINLDTSLTDFEMKLKKINDRYPERQLDFPHTIDEIHDILHEISLKSNEDFSELLAHPHLEEKNFFLHNTDIEIYQHLRYLPATWHTHDFIEISYVVAGTCTNYIMQQKLTMNTGDICIIAPDTPHSLSAFSDDCLMFNYLIRTSTFENAFFGVLATNAILSDFFMQTLYRSNQHPYLLFQTGEDSELLYYIGLSYQEFHRNRQYKSQMLNSVVEAFFITLLRNHGANIIMPEADNSAKNGNTVLILKYMSEHYDTITLSQLANFFNYSERQIQRIIKTSTGISFSENIQKMKLKQAVRLLENTNKSIALIAEELGYSDSGNFRHIFKKYYGVTPAEYRTSKA